MTFRSTAASSSTTSASKHHAIVGNHWKASRRSWAVIWHCCGLALAIALCFLPDSLVAQQTAEDALRARLGTGWTLVKTERDDSRLVVRELARPYPAAGLEATTGSVTATSQVQSIAATFLGAHAEDLLTPLSLPGPQRSLIVKETYSSPHHSEAAPTGQEFTVVYAQVHQAVPVFEASIVVGVAGNGEVWSVINRAARVDAGLSTTPALGGQQALGKARETLGDTTASPDSEPVLYVFAPSHLAWRLNFLAPHFKEFLVDAASGAILMQRKNARN